MVLFFFCINYIHSQIDISGFITDAETKEPIEFVSVLLKDENNTIISFTSTNQKGFYKINIPDNQTEVSIQTSMLSYFPKEITIKKEDNKEPYHIQNIELSQRTSALDEVLIETKKAILVKNDTTVYKPNQFKDGSERNVEDLLKKLPGITIADNGSIKFKGKEVTRVL
ncbi:MAG: carboxypeptidase-like regulatory domain-containing protein, partial [Xanthomarina sp.]